VVIGEPQRAFYGNQFGLTFPLFVHYGVQLWVPEVGGATLTISSWPSTALERLGDVTVHPARSGSRQHGNHRAVGG
jgi:hypothetical protein